MSDTPFILSPGDKQSPVWRRLVGHLSEELTALRGQLEGDHDERKTAAIRGRIAAIKGLLELDKDRPYVEKPVATKF